MPSWQQLDLALLVLQSSIWGATQITKTISLSNPHQAPPRRTMVILRFVHTLSTHPMPSIPMTRTLVFLTLTALRNTAHHPTFIITYLHTYIQDWIASATGKASHIRHGLNAALYSAKTALQVSRENPNAQPTATALAEFLATLSSTSDIEDLHTSGVAEGGENGASRGRELKPAAGAGAGAGEVVQGQPHQQIQKRELGTGLAGTKLIDWLLEVAVTSGPSSPEADAMERYLLRVLRHADATSALLARPGNATRLLILTGRSPQLRKALDSLLSSSSSSMYGSISQIEYSTGLSVSSSSSVLPPIEVSVADAKEVVRLAGQRSQPPGQQLLTLRLLRYWADSSVLNCVRLASAGAGSVVADVASTSDDRTTRFTVVRYAGFFWWFLVLFLCYKGCRYLYFVLLYILSQH